MTTPFGKALGEEVFAEDTQMGFLGYLANQGIPSGQQRFLRNRWSPIYDLFRQQQAGQLNQGVMPTSSFTSDFLPGFNLQDYRRQFSPQDRGEGIANFLNRTRFRFR